MRIPVRKAQGGDDLKTKFKNHPVAKNRKSISSLNVDEHSTGGSLRDPPAVMEDKTSSMKQVSNVLCSVVHTLPWSAVLRIRIRSDADHFGRIRFRALINNTI
jgi:hypothetical protein